MESGRPDTETPSELGRDALCQAQSDNGPPGKIRQGYSHQNIKGRCSLLDVGRRAGSQSERHGQAGAKKFNSI